jgi:GH18 family chitinase
VFGSQYFSEFVFCANAFNDVKAINAYLKQVPSPGQFNLGIPFYGKYYASVSSWGGQCASICRPKTPAFNAIEPSTTGSLLDPATQTPYLLNAPGYPGFLTYDDATSVSLKASYAKSQVGGMFIWRLEYDDATNTLLSAMYAAYSK